MVVENESPLKQEFDKFDISHMDWTMNDYKEYALKQSPEYITSLLVQDWTWRYHHKQNVVASIEGDQGSGKSMPFYSAANLLGNIFKKPFSLKYLFFELEELNVALGKAQQCETFVWDEYRKHQAGVMSLLQRQNLADFEDQLRVNQNNLLYCAPELQDHSHFFIFESKNTVWDEEGKIPKAFLSILKTKRYTDRHQLVWRGLVFFPMPSLKDANDYLVKKRQHIGNLQTQNYSTLDPVREAAKNIIAKRFNDLVHHRRDGIIIPIKRELMMCIIDEEIGTSKFTIQGYKILEGLIRKHIDEKFKDNNEALYSELDEVKQERRQEKEERANKLLELKALELEEKRKDRELKQKELEFKIQKASLQTPVPALKPESA